MFKIYCSYNFKTINIYHSKGDLSFIPPTTELIFGITHSKVYHHHGSYCA